MVLPPGPVGLKFWQPRNETTQGPQAWYTLYDVTLTGNGSNSGNQTLRQAVATSVYNSGTPATGTKIRVTIQSSSTVGITWDSVYVGHAAPSGDIVDFDGSQIRLLWSGSASGSVAAATSLVSDEINFAFDKNRSLVISIHTTGTTATSAFKTLFPAPGFHRASKVGADEAATTDVDLSVGYTEADNANAFGKIEIYADAPVGSSATLTAGGGSYTLNGSEAGLGPGYQLTGSDVTFTTASSGTTTLAADAGSYALTGTAAGLVYPTTLAAAAGNYALTGSAVGLGLGYWITGSDVTFATATAGGTTLTAAAGSYTLTGSAAALALRHTAGVGAYSLTGTAATYRITLTAAAGSYALTGSPAGFLAPFRLPAAGGAYTLTGFDAALTVISGVVLFCGSGSYTLTGFDAAFIPPIGPVEPPSAGGVGSVSRGRMIRKRRKREEEEEPIPVIGSTPVPEVPPGPSLPPQPGLMAHMPSVKPAKIPKRADPDEEEDEIALLLELIS